MQIFIDETYVFVFIARKSKKERIGYVNGSRLENHFLTPTII